MVPIGRGEVTRKSIWRMPACRSGKFRAKFEKFVTEKARPRNMALFFVEKRSIFWSPIHKSVGFQACDDADDGASRTHLPSKASRHRQASVATADEDLARPPRVGRDRDMSRRAGSDRADAIPRRPAECRGGRARANRHAK